MALTVKQVIVELGGTPGDDAALNNAIVLLETDDGWSALENPTFHRTGLPETEATIPALVFEDGGDVGIA